MDGTVYRQLPADRVGRLDGVPEGARWIAQPQGYPDGISRLAGFGTRALQDPQQALDSVTAPPADQVYRFPTLEERKAGRRR